VEVTDKVKDASRSEKNKLALWEISICNMGIGLERQPMENTISRSHTATRFINNLNSILSNAQKPESLAPMKTVFLRNNSKSNRCCFGGR